jgi:hypothetical protein
MNRVVKLFLILLGIAVIGYAIFAKLGTESPMSALENSLGNAVHQGDVDQALKLFKTTMDRVEAAWNPVIILGLIITLAACFIKSQK